MIFFFCLTKCLTKRKTYIRFILLQIMTSSITIRISDGMKAEIETLVKEIGLWHDMSSFTKEALNEHIKKYWQGDRFDNKY